MADSLLPSAPPKPDFSHRIKLKRRYSELKAQFYEAKNRAVHYKKDLAEKEGKENKIRIECDLILDQIEIIRTRLPPPSIDAASPEEEPERKRIKRYQTHDPSLPFLFDSDGGDDYSNTEEAGGYEEKVDVSDGGRTEMETASVGSLGAQPFQLMPSRAAFDGDVDADADEDADADAELDAEGEGDEDEDGEAEDDDSEEDSPEQTQCY